MAESEVELKSLLMKVKEESEKAGLKLNIKKKKIMVSSPITSWQTKGEKVEAVTDFLFLSSKITVDGDCSREIRRWLLLGRKAMTNLDSVLKNKVITLPTEVHTTGKSHVHTSFLLFPEYIENGSGFYLISIYSRLISIYIYQI